MRISSTGVGIGTPAPSSMLHVNITSASSVNIANNSNSLFFVNGTTGNVGIGTTNATQKLDVRGNINTTGNITMWDGNQSFSVRGDGGALTEQFGYNARAIATSSTAIGNAALANGSSTLAIGYGATAYGINSVAIGKGALTTNQAAVAVGQSSNAVIFGVALGSAANSSDNGAIAIGQNASATGARSIAIGENSRATAQGQLVIGAYRPSFYVSDAYFGSGVTDVNVTNFTLHATGGSGTDITGGYISIAGGRSTGNATGGEIRFETSDAGATGSTLRTLTEKMRITGPGLVGIGTTTPSALLHIKNSSSLSSKLLLLENLQGVNGSSADIDFSLGGATITTARISANRTKEGAYTDLGFSTFDGSNLLQRMTIKSDGKVGINDTSPDALLDVNVGSGNLRVTSGGTDNVQMQMVGSSGASANVMYDTGELYFDLNTAGNHFIWRQAGQVERMRLDSNGNLGIGTASPGEKLEVLGNISINNTNFYKAKSLTGTAYSLAGITSGNVIQIGAIDYTTAGTIFAGGDNSKFTTGGAAGTTRMTIANGGNIGIGTASPNYALEINNNTKGLNVSNNLFVNGSSVGIGVVNPSQALEINGSLKLMNGSTNSFIYLPRGSAPSIYTYLTHGQIGTVGSDGLSIYSNSVIRANFHDTGYITLTPATYFAVNTSAIYLNATVGNVGLGTTTPSNKLDVRGDINASSDIYFNNGTKVGSGNLSGGGTAGYLAQWSGTSGLNNSPIYTSGGNVGIGTTSSVTPLTIRKD